MGNNWRGLKCDGCPLACRYRDFHVFDRNGFAETVQSLYVETDDPSKWRYKRRRTILGMMHEHKRDLWKQHTQGCPNNGLTAVDIAVQDITDIVLRDAIPTPPAAAGSYVDALDDLGPDFVSQTEEVPF
jgi:hypothetical protein